MITVSTTIDTNLKHAWQVYTLPEFIIRWNHASDDWECPVSTNELRVDGKFVSTMRAKDKSVSFDIGGSYTKIVEYKEIFYTMDDGRKAEVSFDEVKDSIVVTVKFDPENENPEEMQRSGWQAILDNFKKECEKDAGDDFVAPFLAAMM